MYRLMWRSLWQQNEIPIEIEVRWKNVNEMGPWIIWRNELTCIHPWWRFQMETLSALLVLCEGNPHLPVTRSFDIFFDLHLNKRLSKQSRGRWFEMPSRSLWRYCNARTTPTRRKSWTYMEQHAVFATKCIFSAFEFRYFCHIATSDILKSISMSLHTLSYSPLQCYTHVKITSVFMSLHTLMYKVNFNVVTHVLN